MQRVWSALRIGLLLGWLVSLFLISTPRAYACSCAMLGLAASELANSAAVFAGEVTQMQGPAPAVLRSSMDPVRVTFKVSEVWKGDVQENQVISTVDSISCGYNFVVGQQYLVYARTTDIGLSTSICYRTAPLSSAAQDLADLGPGESPLPAPPAPSGISAPVLIGIGSLIFIVLTAVIWFLSRRFLR